MQHRNVDLLLLIYNSNYKQENSQQYNFKKYSIHINIILKKNKKPYHNNV